MARSVRWRVACVVVLAFNTWASWSSAVATWFSGGAEDAGDTWVPRFVLWVLENRPDVGDADIHLIMWFMAGVVVTGAVYGRRRWGWWVVAVWGWSLLLEALQPVVSTVRGREWIDAVGNTMGIALGVAVVVWWRTRRDAAG